QTTEARVALNEEESRQKVSPIAEGSRVTSWRPRDRKGPPGIRRSRCRVNPTLETAPPEQLPTANSGGRPGAKENVPEQAVCSIDRGPAPRPSLRRITDAEWAVP